MTNRDLLTGQVKRLNDELNSVDKSEWLSRLFEWAEFIYNSGLLDGRVEGWNNYKSTLTEHINRDFESEEY